MFLLFLNHPGLNGMVVSIHQLRWEPWGMQEVGQVTPPASPPHPQLYQE